MYDFSLYIIEYDGLMQCNARRGSTRSHVYTPNYPTKYNTLMNKYMTMYRTYGICYDDFLELYYH